MVEMSFVPPIRPRVSVADEEMLEAERWIAQQTWSVVGFGEVAVSTSRSGRGKGTIMMRSISHFQGGRDEEEGEQQEKGEWEEERGGCRRQRGRDTVRDMS
ncbi:hypothetical protein Dimus_038243 [Dionaea muscipula]